MLFVDNLGITAPQLNLALEEHLLRHLDLAEPLLLFYINEPAVIIGRNQNTAEEIDPDYVRENGIHVVRRLSGGGAVFHDLGNLNFSFITSGKEDLHNFAKFTEPVVRVLSELGAQAELRGRSDIFVDGKKVSGNAQFAAGQRMFSHGTLLFDTNLEHMLRALNPRQAQIESKAVQSIRQYVTNVRDYLPAGTTITDLRDALLQGIFGTVTAPRYTLSDEAWTAVNRLRAERYDTWEWNVGKSPDFNQRKQARLSAGKIDVHLDVAHGLINRMAIFGDFSGERDVAELQERLVGLRHDPAALREALAGVDLSRYFGSVTLEEFLELLY